MAVTKERKLVFIAGLPFFFFPFFVLSSFFFAFFPFFFQAFHLPYGSGHLTTHMLGFLRISIRLLTKTTLEGIFRVSAFSFRLGICVLSCLLSA